MRIYKPIFRLAGLSLLIALNGCAVSTKDTRDPLENWNRGVQTFNDTVDDYAVKPIAKGYKFVMPSFADTAVTNFFNNLDDINVSFNDLLQGKFKQSAEDTARFLVNSVAGIGGLVDVAQHINLPKHNEDFDQTLGFWGVPTGPYIVLPVFGPSSTRGIGGKIGDAALNPLTYTGFFSGDIGNVSRGLSGLKLLDTRADLLETEKIASEAAIDRYDFYKNSYMQRREFLVKDGKVAEENIDFDDKDFESDTKSKMKAPASGK